MIPRETGGGSPLRKHTQSSHTTSTPSLHTRTSHPVRKGYSRSSLPKQGSASAPTHDRSRETSATLSSSQRADRTRTAGRVSAQAARVNRVSLGQSGFSSSQRADRTRTAGRVSAITARENRKSLHPPEPQADFLKGAAIGSSVTSRKLSQPNRSISRSSQANHATYGYDEMRHKADPSRRTSSSQRQRIWRGMAEDPRAPLTEVQRERIRENGRAPTWHNPITGRLERMELAHEPRPFRSQGTIVTPRWPEDHAARDSHRHLSRPVREAYETQGSAIRDRFAKDVVQKEWGYTIRSQVNPSHPRVPSAAGGLGESTARGVTRGVLRGASRAALPVAAAIDAYDLTRTYQNGGNTPEFRSQAAGVAGGWAGAAAGAQLGATIGSFVPIPGVGTVAGGLIGGGIGYLVGSGVASELEEGVEEAAPKVWEGAKSAWNSVFG